MATRFTFVRSAAAIPIAIIFLFATVWLYVAGYFPGTLRKDEDGWFHGTGTTVYSYPNGAILLKERYLAGKLKHSTWYKPNATVFAETSWTKGTNVGYFLRQDGTLRIKMSFLGQKAHGLALYYKEDCVTLDHTAEFRSGVKIDPR